jgi:hypothetical protein
MIDELSKSSSMKDSPPCDSKYVDVRDSWTILTLAKRSDVVLLRQKFLICTDVSNLQQKQKQS